MGAWSQEIIRDLKIPVKVHANFLHWFQVETPKLHSESPCYVFEKDYGFFYGFPSLDGGTVKIAAHSPGVLLETAESERPIQDPDYEALERFGKESLRSFQEGASSSKSCLYSMTPDENFIVDRHPNFKKVFFAAGFSGHGFKFSPAIGRLLLQITREESEPFQSEFLRFDRFR